MKGLVLEIYQQFSFIYHLFVYSIAFAYNCVILDMYSKKVKEFNHLYEY
ncbi:hypothetical protein KP77_06750 [Jeotgalibacillus alimentarius]|uniref:Uncharacterized protein n=1 Tax=Jeotgalibacillus alimentarius TaxID=135826 RepID=A0A0C2RQ73_9BACL|nr:hypothetical protein KP77_06750 [Jeotgalibacillus alimentarius]